MVIKRPMRITFRRKLERLPPAGPLPTNVAQNQLYSPLITPYGKGKLRRLALGWPRAHELQWDLPASSAFRDNMVAANAMGSIKDQVYLCETRHASSMTAEFRQSYYGLIAEPIPDQFEYIDERMTGKYRSWRKASTVSDLPADGFFIGEGVMRRGTGQATDGFYRIIPGDSNDGTELKLAYDELAIRQAALNKNAALGGGYVNDYNALVTELEDRYFGNQNVRHNVADLYKDGTETLSETDAQTAGNERCLLMLRNQLYGAYQATHCRSPVLAMFTSGMNSGLVADTLLLMEHRLMSPGATLRFQGLWDESSSNGALGLPGPSVISMASLEGRIGEYLALACPELTVEDCFHLGIISDIVPEERLSVFADSLNSMPSLHPSYLQICLQEINAKPVDAGRITKDHLQTINTCFSQPTLDGIVGALERSRDQPFGRLTAERLGALPRPAALSTLQLVRTLRQTSNMGRRFEEYYISAHKLMNFGEDFSHALTNTVHTMIPGSTGRLSAQQVGPACLPNLFAIANKGLDTEVDASNIEHLNMVCAMDGKTPKERKAKQPVNDIVNGMSAVDVEDKIHNMPDPQPPLNLIKRFDGTLRSKEGWVGLNHNAISLQDFHTFVREPRELSSIYANFAPQLDKNGNVARLRFLIEQYTERWVNAEGQQMVRMKPMASAQVKASAL
eukprot:Clim_evm12s77 gene=Clim_evmTU12s77